MSVIADHGSDVSRKARWALGDLLLAGSIFLAFVVAALMTAALMQIRDQTLSRAERTSENLLLAVSGDIERNLEIYRFALLDIAHDLSDPGVEPSREVYDRFLERALEMSEHIRGVMLLDSTGEVLSSSGEVGGARSNVANEPFFRDQRTAANEHFYLSQAYPAGALGSDASVVLSLRVAGAEAGDFLVAAAVLPLSYFGELSNRLHIGAGGGVILAHLDGFALFRMPQPDSSVGRNLGSFPNFTRMIETRRGAFIARSQTDGIDKLYTFGPVEGAPLLAIVTMAMDDILADWRRGAILIGVATVAVCLLAIAFAMIARREMARRTATEAELERLSATDGLTGLANRRSFDASLSRALRRARRTGAYLSLLIIDNDNFKLVNDHYGHARGDAILKSLAHVLRDMFRRQNDFVARIGGEEFAILLPDTESRTAAMMADDLRHRLEQRAIVPGADGPCATTVSIGVATLAPGDERTEIELLAAADKALYAAKSGGRNAVIVAT